VIEQLLRPARHVSDWGGMQTAQVKFTAEPENELELQEIVRHAAKSNWKVSSRGIGHSAGGQSFADDVLMIDLRRLNKVLDFNPQKSTIRVQTGASWAALTRLLEPHRLSITTKQEFDSFSIGGSLAANVHGKTCDYGPLIDHVESFRLLQSDGDIIQVSREENAELFSLAIGGYGLVGIIVDATFRLVEDRVIHKTEICSMSAPVLIQSYLDRVQRKPRPPLCYGFLNANCDNGFYVTYEYLNDGTQRSLEQLPRDEPKPWLFNLSVLLQRYSSKLRSRGVQALWLASGKPETTLRSRRLLLWDTAPSAFDGMLLQKYFVPVARFAEFATQVGSIFAQYERRLPLLMNHFRFVPGNDEAVLSFAPQDSVCLIPCYLAKKNSTSWKRDLEAATQLLLKAAVDVGGSYYLTFDILATCELFERAYPRWRDFSDKKLRHDPNEMFTSCFYKKYFAGRTPRTETRQRVRAV
jgi:decaprenylphospho-beta-D-ribofuranose 2-oxidase